MTTSRDPDRLIHEFLLEGGDQLQDQVYDAVRAEIDRRRQRSVIGRWRLPTMNKLVPIGLGAAAVAVALVVGTQLLGPSPQNGVGGPPSPSPSVSAGPTATLGPTATPSASVAAGLSVGPHALLKAAPLPGGSGLTSVAVDVTIPAADWFGAPGEGIVTKNSNSDPPDGAGLIAFADVDAWFVPSDPCRWEESLPDTPARTTDALVAALAAQKTRSASAPEDVTVGGHAGQAITLHVPDDAELRTCDQGQFCSLANPELDPIAACFRYHQGAGQIDRMTITEVGDRLVVIDSATYAGTPAEDAAELRAIVDSVTFP